MSLFSIFDLGNYLTSFCYIRYFGFALQTCADFHSVRISTYVTKDFKSFTFFRPQNELFVMILRAYKTNHTHTPIHMHMHTSITTHIVIYVLLHSKNLLQGQITEKYDICRTCGRGPYTNAQSRTLL